MRFVFGVVHKVVIFSLVYVLVSIFLIQPVLIDRSDMAPNYLMGDVVFIRKYSYGYNKNSFPFSLPLLPTRIFGRTPNVGDVIAYVTTKDMQEQGEGRIALKRVLALPGDKVSIRNGILYINDKKNYIQRDGGVKLFENAATQSDPNNQSNIYDRFVEEHHSGFKYHTIQKGPLPRLYKTMEKVIVPEGHFFVIGDKRDTSIDTRVEDYGFVSMESIMGEVKVIFFKINLPKGELRNYAKWLKSYDSDRFLVKVQNP